MELIRCVEPLVTIYTIRDLRLSKSVHEYSSLLGFYSMWTSLLWREGHCASTETLATTRDLRFSQRSWKIFKFSSILRCFECLTMKTEELPKLRDINQVKSQTSTTKLRKIHVFRDIRLLRLLDYKYELRSYGTSVYWPCQIRDSHREVEDVTSPLGC